MKSFLRFALVTLLLLVVAMVSAVVTMSLAIHGTEVAVPNLLGMNPVEAERSAATLGLSVAVERQYYSSQVQEGRIMTQIPAPGTRVRRGWQVRVAQSLGAQRVAVPDVLGESGRAADLNIRRRGLDVASIAYIPMTGITSDQVLAQSPPANANSISAPRINLLVSAGSQQPSFVMPSFIGQPLGTVNLTILDAGFHVGLVTVASGTQGSTSTSSETVPSSPPQPSPSSIVLSQTPAPGQRVVAGAVVNFEVR
jgi:eukaryotic-like serine/threonine-protein kinase